MLDFVIFAVTFLTVLLVAIVWLYPSSKKVTTIPGLDPSSKEDGNLSDICRAGSLHEFLLELHGRFGDISGFWWGQTYVVSIASPQLFKAHSNVFDKPPELFGLFQPLFGSASIVYTNGSEARSRRKNYDRAFSHDSLQKYYSSFQEVADVIEEKWSKRGESDHVPLCEDMTTYSMQSGLLTLMGENFKDEKLVQSVRNAYSKAWSEMEHRLMDPVAPEENSVRHKSLQEAVSYLYKTVLEVHKHRQQNRLQGEKLLIDIISESTTDEDVLKNDVITYFIGAYHTTANWLTWAVYFLATHPDVQNKLHKEIIQVLGQKDVVTPSSYGQLKFLNQVLEETLRCAVVAPWGARVQDFNYELGGHKIPKNTPVIHAFGVVFQDDKLWPLPKRFDPDRFSDENSKDRQAFAFAPFGFAGKRVCPGYKFSYIESTVLLATLIRKFEVSLWEDQVVQPVHGFVTHPQEEIWLKLTKRT